MPIEMIVKRYSAYYAGWCVAFGEHELDFEEEVEIQWIIGADKVGVTLSPQIKKQFVRELLAKQDEMPKLILYDQALQVGSSLYQVNGERQLTAFDRFKAFLREPGEIHMYLTSHFCLPQGTRIVTFGRKKPQILIYKEIRPLWLYLA